MKTIITKNLIVLCLISLLLALGACSKFDEGPKISFRSVVKRIYGTYRIDYFAKNGIDLTDYWNQYYDITFDFHKAFDGVYPDIHGTQVSGFIDSCGVMKGYSINSYLTIINDDDIKIGMHNYYYDSTWYPGRLLYPIFINPGDIEPLFVVSKLKNEEMWVKHINGNDIYEIHFIE